MKISQIKPPMLKTLTSRAALIKPLSVILASGFVILSLNACTYPVDRERIEGESHYWQRRTATSATYTRGPKAQQMLNRDISACVVEVRELDRLGALHHVFPEDPLYDPSMAEPPSAQRHLDSHDTPERDGYLRYEHLPYVDFETCMLYKGWERMKNVPYAVAEESEEVYLKTVLGEKYQSTFNADGDRIPEDDGQYDGLNE